MSTRTTVPFAFTTDRLNDRAGGRTDGRHERNGHGIGMGADAEVRRGRTVCFTSFPSPSSLLFLDHALWNNTLQPRLHGLVALASTREGFGRPWLANVVFAWMPESEERGLEENKEPCSAAEKRSKPRIAEPKNLARSRIQVADTSSLQT